MSRRHKRCICGKVLCRDMDEARKVHAKVWAEKGGSSVVRFYQCRAGAYHWTRQLNPTQ